MNRGPYSNVQRTRDRCGQINIKDQLKQEILKQDRYNDNSYRFSMNNTIDNGAVLGRAVEYGFEDYDLYFDSLFNRSGGNISNGTLTYTITDINNTQDIKSCVEIKIGSFYFPNIINDIAVPDYFFFRRVYLQIVNLPSTQGILTADSKRYHFEFEVENYNGIAVKLVPIRDTFYFRQPITSLSDIEFRFMTTHNFRAIRIPKDRVTAVSVLNSNPAVFTILGGDQTLAIGPIGAAPAPGYAVYITGFDSSDANLNSIVNSPDGIYITDILSLTTFSINTLNFADIPPLTVNVVIAKNRIAFNLRFTCVKDVKTNYLTAVHN
jgi:adhesin HecA-like repeat protein